ncbi:MAG TPA: tetratricopeptide repeat protein, partial [Candidatus Polarisedimenticolia bacterium]|nr:tetratricopeptide repeat protein [Candidatus Polarisedimenticolia bacterium]
EVQANRGLLLSLTGDHASAVAAFEEALRYAPNQPVIHSYLAEALAHDGPQRDLVRALREARRAVALGGSDAASLRTLSAICRASGREDCLPAPAVPGR